MKFLSLYSGAGGFDLGLEKAGFKNVGCIEIDEDARKTIKLNKRSWNLLSKGDIFAYTPKEILKECQVKRRELTLLVGGPPCQPFSKASYWANGSSKRMKDPRAKTLVAYLDTLEYALPRFFIIENVEGITGKNDCLNLIKRRLNKINSSQGTRYSLSIIKLNAANYGVPQMRERIFIVGSRNGRTFKPPVETHSKLGSENTERWLTSWDAIGHLSIVKKSEKLQMQGKWNDLLPSIPEGKNYLWHTKNGGGVPLFGWRTKYWNFLLKLAKNQPSWTLQASPGPATGPFHWNNRLLSIKEMAAIQTFPKGYKFSGDYSSARKQIGNAVPSAIGELLGKEVCRQFLGKKPKNQLSLIPKRKTHCPPPAKYSNVRKRYSYLKGNHKAHAGTGLGPRARQQQRLATS